MKFKDSIFYPGDPDGMIRKGFECLQVTCKNYGGMEEDETFQYDVARLLKKAGAEPAAIALPMANELSAFTPDPKNPGKGRVESFPPRMRQLMDMQCDLVVMEDEKEKLGKILSCNDEAIWQLHVAEGIVNLEDAVRHARNANPNSVVRALNPDFKASDVDPLLDALRSHFDAPAAAKMRRSLEDESALPRNVTSVQTAKDALQAAYSHADEFVKPIASLTPGLGDRLSEIMQAAKMRLDEWQAKPSGNDNRPKPAPRTRRRTQ
jgi:hypothetical protein